jgi:hypothetical protein
MLSQRKHILLSRKSIVAWMESTRNLRSNIAFFEIATDISPRQMMPLLLSLVKVVENVIILI